MTAPVLNLQLHEGRKNYQPGETLSGEYRVASCDPAELRAIEISVLWYTEGKGDEDLAVHHFERVSIDDGQPVDLERPRSFSAVLPNSPLSYEGVIVKIRWCVRVRLFLARGKELVEERPFQLGDVPAARAVLP
jgi:hypothetical protein